MTEHTGGTVRYHRAEYLGDVSFPWEVWFDGGQGPIFFTAEQGEAMGLTPEPAPLVVTCNGRSVELPLVEEAHLVGQHAWKSPDETGTGSAMSACIRFARLLRDARQDPQPASTVEIGGQVMTQAQYDAARFPLLHQDPGPAVEPDTDSDTLDFDAMPVGTVLSFDTDAFDLTVVKTQGGWRNAVTGGEDIPTLPGRWRIAYMPAPVSPAEGLRAVLAGRDDADELIEYAKGWSGKGFTTGGKFLSAMGDAARSGGAT